MKARILAVAAILAGIAVLVVAWIMGDAQPTRWIETPVAVPVQTAPQGLPQGSPRQPAAKQ